MIRTILFVELSAWWRWLWLAITMGRRYADDYFDAPAGIDGRGPAFLSERERKRFQP